MLRVHLTCRRLVVHASIRFCEHFCSASLSNFVAYVPLQYADGWCTMELPAVGGSRQRHLVCSFRRASNGMPYKERCMLGSTIPMTTVIQRR